MLVELRRQLVFRREIVTTALQPDILMWSAVEKRVLMIELTMTTAHDTKHLKYAELAAGYQDADWKARIYPVEVGCRGFVSKAVVQLLQSAGMTGLNLRKAVKELGDHLWGSTLL